MTGQGARRLFRATLGVVLVAGLMAGLVAVWFYYYSISRPLHFGDEAYLIERGESVSQIARNLVEKGILSEPWSLKLYVRFNQVGHLIQAGEYEFPDGIRLPELVDRLVTGQGQIGIRITFIEGWTFRQMRKAIDNAPKLEKITTGWSDERIMQELGHPGLHPEGQFYPDTYEYRRGDADLSIYKKSFLLMRDQLDQAWQQRSDDIQINDRYEALILASIIEKESQVAEEQPLISAVFHNRLRLRMRLQADPTVIYGMGDEYSGRIRRKHLKTDTPYNTYTRFGLTPTPISLPGQGAIMAALRPVQSDSLYFVASGGGRHHFSDTLEEHNAAVRKYILGK